MALINKSFTFGECSNCHKTIKLEVGKDIEGIKCDCAIAIEEEKPKKRVMRKKVEDATESV